MSTPFATTVIRRRARVPDALRLDRYARAPELGPQLLFLSGGSALRATSRALKHYTHNSVHLITAFDSGGSSAVLRRAFGILSVGDLRNRLMALADETVRGNPAIYALFSHRLPTDESQATLRAQLSAMAGGIDPLVSAIDAPLRRIIRTHLSAFRGRAQRDFDLRGASLGNLILAGGMLEHEQDIDSVVFLFSRLVHVLGTVLPIVASDLHLAARRGGALCVGQHLITSPTGAPQPIEDLQLVASLEHPEPASISIAEDRTELIERADLIVFPMGSFYTSVIANVLPLGVSRAIARAGCPKVFVPNAGHDPEQAGMDVGDCTLALLRYLERGLREPASQQLLDIVLLDTARAHYPNGLGLEKLAGLGIEVVDVPLARDSDPSRHDAVRVAEALVSFV